VFRPESFSRSRSIGSGYWNEYVRCDTGVSQTPNDEMLECMALHPVDESN